MEPWIKRLDGKDGKAGKSWMFYLKEEAPGSTAVDYYEEMKKEFESHYDTDKKNRKEVKDM
jgi:hypothetical protein